jgi:hypothetical protein
MTSNASPPGTLDVYVGYLPTPPRHKRLLRVLMPAVLLLAAGIGAAIAAVADDPGPGTWDTAAVVERSGTLRLSPVVFLETDEGPVLLVEQGKFAPDSRRRALAGALVTARGALIRRGPLSMIELLPDASAVAAKPGTPGGQLADSPDTPAEPMTVQAEILDSKCFLGAMKPGRGPTHAACGKLCLRGGIPALIVWTTAEGGNAWAVLEPGPDGVIDPLLLETVGRTATLSGTLRVVHGLPTLTAPRLQE